MPYSAYMPMKKQQQLGLCRKKHFNDLRRGSLPVQIWHQLQSLQLLKSLTDTKQSWSSFIKHSSIGQYCPTDPPVFCDVMMYLKGCTHLVSNFLCPRIDKDTVFLTRNMELLGLFLAVWCFQHHKRDKSRPRLTSKLWQKRKTFFQFEPCKAAKQTFGLLQSGTRQEIDHSSNYCSYSKWYSVIHCRIRKSSIQKMIKEEIPCRRNLNWMKLIQCRREIEGLQH